MCLLRGSVVPWFAPKAERELQFRFLYMLMSSAALAAAKPGGGAQLRAAGGPKNWQQHLQKDREKPRHGNQPFPAQYLGAVTHLCGSKGDATLQEWFPGLRASSVLSSADWRGFTKRGPGNHCHRVEGPRAVRSSAPGHADEFSYHICFVWKSTSSILSLILTTPTNQVQLHVVLSLMPAAISLLPCSASRDAGFCNGNKTVKALWLRDLCKYYLL